MAKHLPTVYVERPEDAKPLGMAEHLDLSGFEVGIQFDIAAEPMWIPVKRVEFPEGEDWGCDMCDGPSVAEYYLDAQSVLGDGGYNTQFCHDDLYNAIFLIAEDTEDVWRVKGPEVLH